MKVCASQGRPHLFFPSHSHQLHLPKFLSSIPSKAPMPNVSPVASKNNSLSSTKLYRAKTPENTMEEVANDACFSERLPRWLLLGGFSFGLAILLSGFDGRQEALALGPEGPLVEEFWENVRRYGIFIITVSTGALYTILQPIFELLKSPVTAILIIIVLAGSFYLLFQVLNAMVGISEFSYEYGY
ncbi:hypothetical protein HPP92_007602 [Vanilla planifolia]|uniref:Uncharacterized protein ycf33 n=1 Tax=Vanilla planifolia TaxID=51239 RepID=A0A835RKJ9_VANPL|nr:hypothetical protein HPP92_007602 [Vanilla planifolia]